MPRLMLDCRSNEPVLQIGWMKRASLVKYLSMVCFCSDGGDWQRRWMIGVISAAGFSMVREKAFT